MNHRRTPAPWIKLAIVLLLSVFINDVATAKRPRKSETPVVIAAREGNLQKVKALIDDGADINTKENHGRRRPLLIVAIEMKDEDLIAYLLDSGADINQHRQDGQTALHVAARMNRLDLCNRFLAEGVELKARTNQRETVLHTAAAAGRIEIAQLFIDHGINLDAKDYRGNTALHLALKRKTSRMAMLLIQGGAGVRIDDEGGVSALEKACIKGETKLVAEILTRIPLGAREYRGVVHERSLRQALLEGHDEIAMMLVKDGASIEATTESEFGLIHLAAEQGRDTFLKFLVDEGIRPDAPTAMARWTPLHFASLNNHREAVSVLCEAGADVNALDGMNRTPLHVAAQAADIIVIGMFLRHGADANFTDLKGNTPLHYAAERGRAPLVKRLIAATEQVSAKNAAGLTPGEIARGAQRNSVIELFAAHTESPTNAVETAIEDDVLALLLDGVSKSRRQKLQDAVVENLRQGASPLFVAARLGLLDALATLLEEDATAMELPDEYGLLPIHAAAEAGNVEIARVLIDAGSQAGAANNPARWTPLHFAASAGQNAVIETLLASGADAEAVDSSGRTPRMIAEKVGHEDTVMLLGG